MSCMEAPPSSDVSGNSPSEEGSAAAKEASARSRGETAAPQAWAYPMLSSPQHQQAMRYMVPCPGYGMASPALMPMAQQPMW